MLCQSRAHHAPGQPTCTKIQNQIVQYHGPCTFLKTITVILEVTFKSLVKSRLVYNLWYRSFFTRQGGLVGFFELSLKNSMTPPRVIKFFSMTPPQIQVNFFSDPHSPPPKNHQLNQVYILYSNTESFWHYQGITIHTTVASVTFNCILISHQKRNVPARSEFVEESKME